MPRFRHPQFTWWPYRTLALVIPLVAFGASVGAALNSTKQGNDQTLEILIVFFAVMGAGTAYLFAMAIGDLGKSVLAVPAGSIAGFVAVHLFSHPVVSLVFVVVLGFLTIHAMLNGIFRTRVGCGGLILLFVAGCAVVGVRRSFEPEISAICAYPFICGVVAAFMPYDRSFGGIRSAWLAGTLNATYGMILAGGIAMATFIFVAFLASGRGLGRAYADVLAIIWAVSALCLANMFCAKNLFYSVYRVSHEPEPEPPGEMAATTGSAPADAPRKSDAPE